jgi:pimeloyl-ACP methyl ester carboxylesterase
MSDGARGDYAEVNGLEMYYEIHGTGQPLVLLHGAYMTIEMFGEVLPLLAEGLRFRCCRPLLQAGRRLR